MRPWIVLLLGAAAYRTTVLVLDDRVPFGPVRDWVWARWPYGDDPTADDPAGRGEATASWPGRWFADRWRPRLARVASWWKNSWGDRVAARDSTRPGSTKIGWLFTCPWCMGVWHAAGWYAAWLRWPAGTIRWATVAAAAAFVGVVYEVVNG